jgi:hypothetical protein
MHPKLTYWTVQPDRWTFGARKIRDWVETRLTGRILNACAGHTQLDHKGPIVRNDIDPAIDADLHYDIRELPDVLDHESFDVFLLDPPFSRRQATETYGRTTDTYLSDDELGPAVDALLRPGGHLIRFGYTTTPLPTNSTYTLEDVALWNTLGRQHDWLATVAQKPMPTETRQDLRPLDVTTQTVPNEHATARGEIATSGNGTAPITLEYHRLNPATSLQTGIAEYVNSHLTGRVLAVSSRERSFTHDDHLVQTSVDPTVEAEYHFDERTLSHEFAAGIFEMVLLDLPSEAFQQTVTYDGQTTGRDTALKQEIHPLVAAGGQIIQIGQTATCMPHRLDYRRDQVAIIEHSTSPHDRIVTIDTKQTTGLEVVTADRSPCDSHVPDSDATPHHTCIRCGTGWALNPAWYIDCPTCGACPENYCVTEDGTIRYQPHLARLVSHDEYHAQHDCDAGITTQVSQPTQTDAFPATAPPQPTEQTSLTQFGPQRH